MVLSTRSDYAVRILAYLSNVEQHASPQAISDNMDIPMEEFKTVFERLSAEGAVALDEDEKVCRLVRPPDQISLKDVILWMGDSITVNRHGSSHDKEENETSVVRLMDEKNVVFNAIALAFSRISIKALADNGEYRLDLEDDSRWEHIYP